jgi:hypothetical protein
MIYIIVRYSAKKAKVLTELGRDAEADECYDESSALNWMYIGL